MKKFGPYKGISNNFTKKDKIYTKETEKNEINTEEQINIKPGIEEIRRKYLSYIERHNRLSEEIGDGENE